MKKWIILAMSAILPFTAMAQHEEDTENGVVSLSGREGFTIGTKKGDFVFKPYLMVQTAGNFNWYDDEGLDKAYNQDNIANSEYLVLDVRKAADFEAGHIPGAVNADMDAAKDGDNESGIANMKAALGDPAKVDQKIVLVCYSGKRYAQAGTNVLAALGANMDNVYTLEGGMKAWTEAGYAVEK